MIHAFFLEDLSVWTWVWQSTLFILLGLAGSFLLRHRPARASQGLFFAIVAAVLVPVMSALVSHFGLGLISPESEPVALEPESTYQSFMINYEILPTILPSNVQLDVKPVEVQADVITEEPAPAKMTSRSIDIPWRLVFLYGWIIAGCALLGRLFVAFVGGACLLRRAQSKCDERIQQAVYSARARFGITKNLRIRSGPNVRSPMIWCWGWSPVLLIPDGLDSRVDWVDVVCHELAHWIRRDHWSGLVAELAVCILPWNPFVWWARKRIVRLSEQACDDWVLAGGRAGTEYAQSLLNLSPKVQMAFLPTMIGKEKPMKERIYRIIKEKCGDPRIGVRWALAMMVIATTLTVGVALAQRRPERFEEREHGWQAEEERERREHKEKLEDQAHELKAHMHKMRHELESLEESGKGEGKEAHMLRTELRGMRESMAEIERDLREIEEGRHEYGEVRLHGKQKRQHGTLRRLEELGHAMALELERLENQRPNRSEGAIALHRRMRELNEQMREVRQALREQLQDPDRHRSEHEDREHSEIDHRIQELVQHLEELKVNARDKEHALHELEERGKGETDDAHGIRRELEEIHGRMQEVKEEIEKVERGRIRIREPRIQYKRQLVHEAIMRERLELEVKAHQIKAELRELGGEYPEKAERLEKHLHEIHEQIEKMEREADRFEHSRSHVEESHVQREHLHERMEKIKHALHELHDQDKGESERAHRLARELHEIHKHLEATEHELDDHDVDHEEREEEEFRIQREHLHERMEEIEHALHELREHGKGEGEKAHRLTRELRAIHKHLEATEHEPHDHDEDHEERGEPERNDLEHEVQELRMQVNNVNEQMSELRELLTRLLEERNSPER